MRSAFLVVFLSVAGCGFGFYADDGSPDPAPNHWGWQCADGTAPDPDAGCLPAECDDHSTPSAADGGMGCQCADGTEVLDCACQTGGCFGDGG